jgi:hypothetical protein
MRESAHDTFVSSQADAKEEAADTSHAPSFPPNGAGKCNVAV